MAGEGKGKEGKGKREERKGKKGRDEMGREEGRSGESEWCVAVKVFGGIRGGDSSGLVMGVGGGGGGIADRPLSFPNGSFSSDSAVSLNGSTAQHDSSALPPLSVERASGVQSVQWGSLPHRCRIISRGADQEFSTTVQPPRATRGCWRVAFTSAAMIAEATATITTTPTRRCCDLFVQKVEE